ncbi:MAG: hypothetical protein WA821_18785 [Anaerolineales bacterium]
MKLVKIPSHSSSSLPELEEKETSNQTGDSLFKIVARFGLKAAAQKMLSGCLVILPRSQRLQQEHQRAGGLRWNQNKR